MNFKCDNLCTSGRGSSEARGNLDECGGYGSCITAEGPLSQQTWILYATTYVHQVERLQSLVAP